LTILNKPGVARTDYASHHSINFVDGDACNVGSLSKPVFDVVFSNSVIEHVGNADKRKEFAREVLRLGRSYWVQTPSMWFPMEAHCGMPFWWFYPEAIRRFFIKGWSKKLPAWTSMVEETSVVTKAELSR